MIEKLKILIGLREGEDGKLPSVKRIANDLESYTIANNLNFQVRNTMPLIGVFNAACDAKAYVHLFVNEVQQQLLHDQLQMPEELAGIQEYVNSVEIVRGVSAFR